MSAQAPMLVMWLPRHRRGTLQNQGCTQKCKFRFARRCCVHALEHMSGRACPVVLLLRGALTPRGDHPDHHAAPAEAAEMSPCTSNFTGKWSLMPCEKSAASIADNVVEAFKHMVERHGGPRQYLCDRYANLEELAKFLDAMKHILPLREDTQYHTNKTLHTVASERVLQDHKAMIFHISSFSFQKQSSVKPDPEALTCIKICERLVHEGFLSAEEPLWVAPLAGIDPPNLHSVHGSSADTLPPMSVGYIKGSARMNTLLTILSFFADDQMDLEKETAGCVSACLLGPLTKIVH